MITCLRIGSSSLKLGMIVLIWEGGKLWVGIWKRIKCIRWISEGIGFLGNGRNSGNKDVRVWNGKFKGGVIS